MFSSILSRDRCNCKGCTAQNAQDVSTLLNSGLHMFRYLNILDLPHHIFKASLRHLYQSIFIYIYLNLSIFCLRSRPVSPDVVSLSVPHVENKGMMTL